MKIEAERLRGRLLKFEVFIGYIKVRHFNEKCST